MPRSRLAEESVRHATRRAVIRAGVTLAYATPLVAASFRLSGLNASAAVVSGVCGPDVPCRPESGCCPGFECRATSFFDVFVCIEIP